MKRIFILAVAILLAGSLNPTFAQQSSGPGAWFRTGSVISYHVMNGAKEYDYVVSDLVIDNHITFNWKMTDPVNYSGKVKIFNYAIDTASIMVNYFENGSSQNMVNKTTAMLSRKIYKRLLSQTTVNVTIDKNDETLKFMRNEKYPVVIDGVSREIDVMMVESETGHKFWILNYPQFPLIIKMELDFTISLKTVETTK
ncbi:MAG TPA: hypothetical protein PKW80_06970 [Bacteroidales bacterium]|nr:hypothetical protein [Bacteroidales bacterium]